VTESRRPFFRALIVAALASSFVAALGATASPVGPWYWGLTKPGWTPPDVAFGIIWTIVFALITVAAAYAFTAAPATSDRNRLITLFALNGFLNVLWSVLFFQLQRPDWALFEIFPFWITIIALIWVSYQYSKIAAILLMPYLIWVSIAAFLNWEVVRLNAPFGG
jgi:translocator protein